MCISESNIGDPILLLFQNITLISKLEPYGVAALAVAPFAYIGLMVLVEVTCLLPYILFSSSRKAQALNALRERKR